MLSPRPTPAPASAPRRLERLLRAVRSRPSAGPFALADEARALAEFRWRYDAYDETAHLDELRATEYARLDAQQQVYLDYTGGSLYAESQLRAHMELLGAN